jgi:hypothetical protein
LTLYKTESKSFESISNYLSKTNVQMGSTYGVGKKSSTLYSAGYAAAAKYINASPSNIGSYSHPSHPLLPL